MADENPNSRSSRLVMAKLIRAVRGRDEDTVEQLLREGGPSVARGWIRSKEYDDVLTLLMLCAIDSRSSDVARSLIRAGCPLNATSDKGNTALHFAASYDNFDVASELIRSGADVCVANFKGNTPLDAAVITTTHLIDLSYSLTVECMPAMTQMWYAYAPIDDLYSAKSCGNNHIFNIHKRCDTIGVNVSLVKMLLDAGAEVNHKDREGYSPILLAVLSGVVELVKILVDAGADVNSKNDIGITALHNAVMCCASDYLFDEYDKAIVLLLNHGASVSAKTKYGDTALHWACAFNWGQIHGEVVRKLLEFGSNVNEKNAKGKTVFDIMLQHRSLRTYRIVIEYVAEMETKTNERVLDEHNLAVISGNQEMKSHYDKCRAELTAMKKRKIGDTLITYLAVLTEPVEVVARYARSEDFAKEFEAGGYKTAYPIHAWRLKAKCDTATARQKSIAQVCTILSTIFQFADSSNAAFEVIARYLTEADIKFLLDSALAESSSSN